MIWAAESGSAGQFFCLFGTPLEFEIAIGVPKKLFSKISIRVDKS
jgi:hypothetical protein